MSRAAKELYGCLGNQPQEAKSLSRNTFQSFSESGIKLQVPGTDTKQESPTSQEVDAYHLLDSDQGVSSFRERSFNKAGKSSAFKATSESKQGIPVLSARLAVASSLSGEDSNSFDFCNTASDDKDCLYTSHQLRNNQGSQQAAVSTKEEVIPFQLGVLKPQITSITTTMHVCASLSRPTSPVIASAGLGLTVSITPRVSQRTVYSERAESQVSVVLSPLSRPLSVAPESPLSTRASLRGFSTRSGITLRYPQGLSISPVKSNKQFSVIPSREEVSELVVSVPTHSGSGTLDTGREHVSVSPFSVETSVSLRRSSLPKNVAAASSESDLFLRPSESVESDSCCEKMHARSLRESGSSDKSLTQEGSVVHEAAISSLVPPVQIMRRPPTVPVRAAETNCDEREALFSDRESDDFYGDMNESVNCRGENYDNDYVDYGDDDNRLHSHRSMQHRHRLFAPLMSRWRTSRRCSSRGSYKRSRRLASYDTVQCGDWNLAERLEQLEKIRVTNFEALEERQQQQGQQSCTTDGEDPCVGRCISKDLFTAGTNDDNDSGDCEGKKKTEVGFSDWISFETTESKLANEKHLGNQTGRSLRSVSTPSSSRTLSNLIAKVSDKAVGDNDHDICDPNSQLNDVDECSVLSCTELTGKENRKTEEKYERELHDMGDMLLPTLGLGVTDDHLPNGDSSRHRSWGSSKGLRSSPHLLLRRTPRSTSLPYHRATSVIASLLQQFMLHDSCINSSKLLQSSSLPVVGDNMYTAATLTKDEPLKRGKRRKFVRWSQRHKNFGSVSRKLNHGNNANHPRAGSGKSGARSAAPTQSPLEAPTTTIVAAGAAVTYAATPHVEKPAEKHLPRSTPVHERGKDRRREGAQFSPCRNEVGSKMSQSLSHSPVSHGIRIGIRNFVSGGIGSNCVTGQFTSPMTARCVSNRRHRVACNPVFQSSTLTAGVLATATKRYPCSLQNTRFKFMTSTSSPPVASAGGGGALPFNRK